ncbi:MAG: hypothetical protein AAFO69_15470 [Bacteroidota bacterium]
MKYKPNYLMVIAFLVASSLLVVSCEEEDIQQQSEIDEVAAAQIGGPDRVVGPTGLLEFEAYYTHIRCGSDNAPPTGIAELKAYFKTKEICECWTWDFEVNNCNQGPGSQMTYARCEKRTVSKLPFGALCPN